MQVLLDPLFQIPFMNGLILAILLPMLGAYTRLRDEWLAALGIAQTTAAGVVIGSFVSNAVGPVAFAAAVLAAAVKTLFGRTDNDINALLILLGWASALLIASNSPHGEDLTRALVEGQLYFTGAGHLQSLLATGVGVALAMPALSRRLLLGRFFPDYFRANGNPHPKHDLAFEMLLAATLALAATAVGVMAAFAFVFIPPWVAFRAASGWRRTLVWSVGLGVSGYLASFVIAVVFDQPYGPVLVAMLILTAVVRPVAGRFSR